MYLCPHTIRSECDNFRKLKQTLEHERGRSKAASDRDTETIIELRTALEMERERSHEMSRSSMSQQQHTQQSSTMWSEGFGCIEVLDQGQMILSKGFIA